MNLGDLNETVTIQQPTNVGKDAVGGDIVVWSTLDSWAVNVQPVNGAERLGVSDAPTSVEVYRLTGRSRDLEPGMRFLYGDQMLEIQSTARQGRSAWTVAMASVINRDETPTEFWAQQVPGPWIQPNWVQP